MWSVYQLLDARCVANKPRLRALLPKGPLPKQTEVEKRKNDSEGRYLCEECGNMFSNFYNLNEHFQRVHPERLEEAKRRKLKYFKCDLCTFCTPRAAFLQRHMLAAHLPAEKPKDWTCEECNKTFLDKYGLSQHKKLHSLKQFNCEEEGCGSSFSHHCLLLRHCKKLHTPKEQLLTCKICGLRVVDTHTEMAHNEKKRYVCQECGSCFRLLRSLTMHRRTHKDARPFKCPHCSYRCRALENLRRHVLITGKHPGLMMYQCKLCTSQAVQFATNCGNDFRSHLLDEHRSEEQANNLGFKQILPFAVGICENYYDVSLKEKKQIVSIKTESELDNTPESESREQPGGPTPIKIQIHSEEHRRLKMIKKFMQPSLNIPAVEEGGEVCDSPILLSSQVNPSCDPIIESVLCEVNLNNLYIPEFSETSAMQSIEFFPSEDFINTQISLIPENQFPEPSVVPTVQNLEFCTATSDITPIHTDNQFVNTQMFHETLPVIQSNREAETRESQLLLSEIQTVSHDATTQGLDSMSENQMLLMEPYMQAVNLCYEEPLSDVGNQNKELRNSTMDSMIFFDPSTQFLPMQPEAVISQVSETPMLNITQNESQMPMELLDAPNCQPMVAAASTQTNEFISDIENVVPAFHNLQSNTQGGEFYESASISTTQFIDNSSDTHSNSLNMIYPNNTQFLQVQDTPLDNVDATHNMFMLHDKVFFETLNLDPDFVNQLGNSLQDFANINVFSDDDFLNNSSYLES
ncbi:hypothetical protein B566_EDAN005130 [Ephemera danica]|nr:hypothetical protein B566_EDAN005130 [Ephemera danica]